MGNFIIWIAQKILKSKKVYSKRVAWQGTKANAHQIKLVNLKERENSENLGVDERPALK
jgi:hypothetical protein